MFRLALKVKLLLAKSVPPQMTMFAVGDAGTAPKGFVVLPSDPMLSTPALIVVWPVYEIRARSRKTFPGQIWSRLPSRRCVISDRRGEIVNAADVPVLLNC